MDPLYATIDRRVRRYVLVVEYRVIGLLHSHSPFFDGRRDVDVLSDIWRLGEGMILSIRSRKGGRTTESSKHGWLGEGDGGGGSI
jgi:hypothetical protein